MNEMRFNYVDDVNKWQIVLSVTYQNATYTAEVVIWRSYIGERMKRL